MNTYLHIRAHLYTDKPVSQRLFEGFLSERKSQVEELEEFKKCINTINTSTAFNNRKKLKLIASYHPLYLERLVVKENIATVERLRIQKFQTKFVSYFFKKWIAAA